LVVSSEREPLEFRSFVVCCCEAFDTCGGKGEIIQILMGKPERNRPHVRLRHRWEDNIRRIFKKLNGGMDWIELTQDRDRWQVFVVVALNFQVP